MPKLTETYARKLPQTDGGTKKYWDSDVRGLVLFCGKRAKTRYFQKDVGGQTKRVLIGRFPAISAKAARLTAMELALEMGRGAGKSHQRRAPTLRRATESYLARPKLRSEYHKVGVRRQFDLHLRDWLDLHLDEITKPMVVDRHRTLKDRPSTANHTLKYFGTVWNHARRTYDLVESPTSAIEWHPEVPKGDIIEDFAAWRDRLDALHNPIHRVFYEFILFTGLRKTEALTLEWKNVHPDHVHLPMTKNGRSFDLPICERHHEILAPLRSLSRLWVFPSQRGVDRHVSAPARMEWSPHAHRRTFATVAVEDGVLEEIVGLILNHTPITITGRRYVKPSLDALRPGMETICNALDRRLDGSP